MRIRVLIIVTLSLFSTPIFSQTGTGTIGPIVEINFKLEKVEFINNDFYGEIDTLVLKSDCPNLKVENNKYFHVRFISNTDCKNSNHEVFFELVNTPLTSRDNIGFFCMKDYIFIISGDIPENFLIVSSETKEFTSRRGKYYVVECFPSWLFLFRDNQLIELIEMDCWE